MIKKIVYNTFGKKDKISEDKEDIGIGFTTRN